MRKAPAYVIICLVFFILIGMGFAYSYFFYPDAHPIACAIKGITGKECPACGFSKAFANYTHGEFQKGRQVNPLSWAVFIFFTVQFFMRGALLIYYFAVRKSPARFFTVLDTVISISLFLLAFLPLILKQF